MNKGIAFMPTTLDAPSGEPEFNSDSNRQQNLRARAEKLAGTTRAEIERMAVGEIHELLHELQIHQVELQIQNEELQRAQLELAQSRDRFTDLFEFAPVGYVLLDKRGRITEANLTTATLLEVTRKDLIGQLLHSFVPREARDHLFLHLAATFEKETKQVDEVPMERNDGQPLTVRVESIQAPILPGTDACCRTALVDVTEQRVLERHLLDAKKMKLVGQLAGGMAHDFNNLLTVIIGCTQMARRNIGEQHPLQDDLNNIRNAAQRGANLIKQLLGFARKQYPRPTFFCLNKAIQGIPSLVDSVFDSSIKLVTIPKDGLPQVYFDLGQLEQVLLNLALNARDAMPQGGTLTLQNETADIVQDAPEFSGLRPGRYVLLTVTDTGTGMSPEQLTHAFEPFYSTKEVGKGTGLGLATCYGILKQNNGHIDCSSREGQGTVFRLIIPTSAPSTSNGPKSA